jgi:glycosyltransferase involved in cell wall biosynthesis
MNVIHLSTNDISGGAARSAYRIHSGLRSLGINSSMLVRSRRSDDEFVAEVQPPQTLWGRARQRLRQERIQRAFGRYRSSLKPGFELFSDDRSAWGGGLLDQIPPASILQLHWIARFVDLGIALPRLCARSPVVWTLHDMNALTGGCHYDLGCGRYQQSCGRCPELGSRVEHDLSRKIWKRKRAGYDRIAAGRLHLVTPSHWLRDHVRSSSLAAPFPVSVIPYGLDLDVFTVHDRTIARDLLGLPRRARVVLFVAEVMYNARKGFSLLRDALQGLAGAEAPILLSLGHGRPVVGGARAMHLGSVDNDRFLSIVYSAADLFVIPSLDDNLPNTVLESMACGTPAVGFAVGGIPEMIRPGETGWLAEPGDVAGLRNAILSALGDDTARAAMGKACRDRVEREHSLRRQAERYIKLYGEIGCDEAVTDSRDRFT